MDREAMHHEDDRTQPEPGVEAGTPASEPGLGEGRAKREDRATQCGYTRLYPHMVNILNPENIKTTYHRRVEVLEMGVADKSVVDRWNACSPHQD